MGLHVYTMHTSDRNEIHFVRLTVFPSARVHNYVREIIAPQPSRRRRSRYFTVIRSRVSRVGGG